MSDSIKYNTEQELCEDVTKLILGILVGEKRKIVCVPEVPHYFFSNDHIDMMLLDVKNLELLFIEYKLNTPSKLSIQVRNRNSKGLKCIGIINTKTKYVPDEYECGFNELFSYTGRDIEIERIADEILYKNFRWSSIYDSNCMVYYWAYKDNQNSFNGGIKKGKREMYYQIFIRAIKNLHKYYGKLDFMLTHSILQSGYSINQSRKYYREAAAEWRRND